MFIFGLDLSPVNGLLHPTRAVSSCRPTEAFHFADCYDTESHFLIGSVYQGRRENVPVWRDLADTEGNEITFYSLP